MRRDGHPWSVVCVEVKVYRRSGAVRSAVVAWRTGRAAVRAKHVLCEFQSWSPEEENSEHWRQYSEPWVECFLHVRGL